MCWVYHAALLIAFLLGAAPFDGGSVPAATEGLKANDLAAEEPQTIDLRAERLPSSGYGSHVEDGA